MLKPPADISLSARWYRDISSCTRWYTFHDISLAVKSPGVFMKILIQSFFIINCDKWFVFQSALIYQLDQLITWLWFVSIFTVQYCYNMHPTNSLEKFANYQNIDLFVWCCLFYATTMQWENNKWFIDLSGDWDWYRYWSLLDDDDVETPCRYFFIRKMVQGDT